VAMARDHGRPHALALAYSTWQGRHSFTRMLAHWCVGYPRRLRATLWVLSRLICYAGPCAPVRLQVSLSGAISNIQYWEGVADAIGLGHHVWGGLTDVHQRHGEGHQPVHRKGDARHMAGNLFRSVTGIGRNLLKSARLFAALITHTPGDLRYVPSWLLSLRKRGKQLSAQVPWLPYSAISYLDRQLGQQTVAFEYGGGGSTLWLARQVQQVTTVEHDADWCASLDQSLRVRSVTNVNLLACPPQADGLTGSADLPNGITYGSSVWQGNFETYVRSIDRFPNDTLDFVLVDGRSRAACVVHAARKVRPGGLLVLDDSDRPRYQHAMSVLKSWQRRDFWGIRPFSLERSHTTCWRRPS